MRTMQVYLVGGAVRDRLLGLPVGERDWVVVGATPEELERQGYQSRRPRIPGVPASADARGVRARAPRAQGRARLPRLHHAVLARRSPSRRISGGATSPSTPWPRARPAKSSIPTAARRTWRRACLRHVSEAFVEDPVRILRVARFAARFAALGFTRGGRDPAADAAHDRGRRGERTGARARVAGNRAGARRGAPRGVLRDAARLRRAGGDLPRARCAVRRAAAAALAPGSRHRRARHAGAALRRRRRRPGRRALRGADARSRQGAHAARALAEPPRPRGAGRAADRGAVRAAQGAERPPRARRAGGALPHATCTAPASSRPRPC